MITQSTIENTIFNLFKEAVIKLPDDVKKALEDAYKNEDEYIARLNLKAILDNIL
jgi:fumarate hydratase subunit alpha